jgi:hypothetical protein
VTAVVCWPDQRALLSSAWSFLELEIFEAKQVVSRVLINNIENVKFFNRF